MQYTTVMLDDGEALVSSAPVQAAKVPRYARIALANKRLQKSCGAVA
jgi:hypothetical protein